MGVVDSSFTLAHDLSGVKGSQTAAVDKMLNTTCVHRGGPSKKGARDAQRIPYRSIFVTLCPTGANEYTRDLR